MKRALVAAAALCFASSALAQNTDQPGPGPARDAQTLTPQSLPVQAPAASPEVSGVTVSPKAGANLDPKIQCPDEACVKNVVRELKTRFPKQYRGLMQWCMANESGRAALQTNDQLRSVIGGQQSTVFDAQPKSVEEMVCDSRFEK